MSARAKVPWLFLLVAGLGLALIAWFRWIHDDGADETTTSIPTLEPPSDPAPAPEPATPLTSADDPLARIPATATATVDPTPASTTTIDATRACTITGRCVDAAGRPIGNARIDLLWCRGEKGRPESIAPHIEGRAAEDGRFELAFDPGPNLVTLKSVGLTLKQDGFARARVEVPSTAPRRFDAGDVLLERGVTLTGFVRDASGVREPRIPVRVLRIGIPDDLQRDPDSIPSRDDGTFVFADAPPGDIRIHAQSPDGRRSDDVLAKLASGERKDGIELVLPLYEDPLSVTGIVVDPDGKPVAEAKVDVRVEREGGSSTFARTTDERGRFRARGFPASVFTLRASDRDHTIGRAVLEKVPVGTHGVRLVLRPPRAVTLRVVDGSGAPIERFGWAVIEDTAMSVKTVDTQAEAARPGGTVLLHVDVDPVSVRVDARSYESSKLGPFALDAVGNVLEARLSRMPLVRGVVTRDGRAVQGAAITMLDPLPSNESYAEDGFDQRFEQCTDCPKATSDAEGKFELAPSKRGVVVVRASKAGMPVVIADPIDVQPDRPDFELRMEIPADGSIAGQVRRADGTAEPGWNIYASSGDGAVLDTRTDAGGRYRFDALAPGGWQVRAQRPEVEGLPGNSERTKYVSRVAPPIVWDCQVAPGATCTHDFVLSPPCELVLRLEEPFKPATWRATASIACSGVEIEEETAYKLKPVGDTLAVSLPCSGKGYLSFDGSLDGSRWSGNRRLELAAGPNEIALSVPTCSLEGRVPANQSATARVTLSWHRAADELDVRIHVKPGADGRFSIPHAPAGASTLGVEGTGPARAKKLDVPAGETLDVGEL